MYTTPPLSDKISDKNMNEILASIRQTITEEFGYREKSHSERAHMTAASTDQDIQSIETEEDVLELTQVLQDDGTIIDLRGEGAPMSSKIIIPKETTISLSRGREAKETQTSHEQGQARREQGQTSHGQEFKQVHQEHDLSEQIESFAHTPQTTTESTPPSTSEATTESQPAVTGRSPFAEEIPSAAASGAVEQAMPERSEELLIAEQTVQESLAALSTLRTYAAQPTQSPSCSDTRNQSQQTLEGMVREMLRPMLKEWLDANLPSLVKWVVTEQVERLCKEMRK
jgi:hypothetical protein